MTDVYPKIMLMVTDSLVPAAEGAKEEPMSWGVSGAHPFIPKAQIVAIYGSGSGIDVYSARRDEKTGEVEGMRDHIPMSRVRVLREAMSYDVFDRELAAAELGDDEEDDDDGGENGEGAPEHDTPPSAVASLVSPVAQPDDQTPATAQSNEQPAP